MDQNLPQNLPSVRLTLVLFPQALGGKLRSTKELLQGGAQRSIDLRKKKKTRKETLRNWTHPKNGGKWWEFEHQSLVLCFGQVDHPKRFHMLDFSSKR